MRNFDRMLLYGLTIFFVVFGGAVVYCLIELYRIAAMLGPH